METLEIKRGDTETLSLVFTDEDGDAFNITGGIVFLTIKNLFDNADNDDSALIEKEQDTHTSPTTGDTEIILTPAETRSLNVGEYKADIQFKDSGGGIKSTEQIKVIVTDDVTKRTV
jgi:hypothetical protein